MAYAIGVALFALGILVSVCLHEAGHMYTAKAFGMKVTQYFVGFGPTLFSRRRGETEYGVKAIPAGGFVKIIGMTPLEDDVSDRDEPRAFWRKPLWQRTVVLSAGSITHFILGFILLWIAASFVGVPNPQLAAPPAVIGEVPDCVVIPYETDGNALRDCKSGDPASPAGKAGLKAGDKITAVDGKKISDYNQLVDVVREHRAGQATITYVRDGREGTATVALVSTQRPPIDDPKGDPETVSAMGVAAKQVSPTVTYGPVKGFTKAGSLVGQGFAGTFQALVKFPERIPPLIDAIFGEERAQDTPVSVVGASRIGGEAVEQDQWSLFVLVLATLNLFVGVFNLFPLLPLDGGHIAIAWFERVRSWWAARRGRPDPGRVDYMRLLPLTYAVIIVFGAVTLLTVAADIVNPIRLYQ
jgi:membrane-associated protease RseP (regulator of RpoE activity)